MLDPSVLQPDHAGSLADDAGAGWLFAAGAALAAVAATGLLIERLPLPGFRRRLPPFAAAARQIARQRKASPAAALEAVLRLHEAFDATVGRRVFADDLDDFLAAHRHFLPLRADVEQFFSRVAVGVFRSGQRARRADHGCAPCVITRPHARGTASLSVAFDHPGTLILLLACLPVLAGRGVRWFAVPDTSAMPQDRLSSVVDGVLRVLAALPIALLVLALAGMHEGQQAIMRTSKGRAHCRGPGSQPEHG